MGLPIHIWSDLLAVVLFGLVLTAVLAVGTKAFDWLYRKVDLEDEVKKGNVAAAMVLSAVVFGLSYAVATVVKGVLG